MCYIWSYSSNALREILKSSLLLILKVLERRPSYTLKTSRKKDRRVTALGRPQEVNFEPLVQMHFHCIIFIFISSNMCQKHERVSCFIVLGFWRNVLSMFYKGPKVTSGGGSYRDVPRTSLLSINTKRISVVIFSVLVHQMCVLHTKKVSYCVFFQFWRNVPWTS